MTEPAFSGYEEDDMTLMNEDIDDALRAIRKVLNFKGEIKTEVVNGFNHEKVKINANRVTTILKALEMAKGSLPQPPKSDVDGDALAVLGKVFDCFPDGMTIPANGYRILRNALIAQSDPDMVRTWQPISTAPIDGTVVDLFLIGLIDYYRQPNCYWSDSHEYWCLLDGGFPAIPKHRTATHWMPTPQPPKSKGLIE